MKKAGDDGKDLGVMPCHRCDYEHAAIRKNVKGYLYIHCYACGPDIGMQNKLCQDMIGKRGRVFRPDNRPVPAPAVKPPAKSPPPAESEDVTERRPFLSFADDNE